MIAVDLFSGAGGFSSGAHLAGVDVAWAANHWPVAVECHSANFPDTTHVCQDLSLYPSCEIPDHDILLASPSCKGFSPARGKDQAHRDKHRATAWVVVDALEAKRPPFAIVENVPEMLTWSLYPAWKHALEILGYSIQECILDAADFGVPQHRVRLFVALTRGKHSIPLSLPKAKTGQYRAVNDVLDWDGGNWSDIYKPRRSKKTIARIERAVEDGFGPRFLTPYYGSGSGLTGRSLDRPIGTLTTKARWALVDTEKSRMRMLSVEEARDCMGFPQSYRLPKTKAEANAVLGNAVCPPVASSLITQIKER